MKKTIERDRHEQAAAQASSAQAGRAAATGRRRGTRTPPTARSSRSRTGTGSRRRTARRRRPSAAPGRAPRAQPTGSRPTVSGGIASTISFTAGSSPTSLAQQHDQQVDAEIADRRPVIIVILLEPGRMAEVELDPVAAHVAEQIDQRRDRRVKQRQRGREDDERQDTSRLPPGSSIARQSSRRSGFNPHCHMPAMSEPPRVLAGSARLSMRGPSA